MAGPAGFASSEQQKNAEMAPFNSNGWTGRIRTCECWDQNPVPYRLATVQRRAHNCTTILR